MTSLSTIRSASMTALLAMTATLTSCHHKDLCFDHTHNVQINVVFDWQKAPQANPASMAAYFFNGSHEPLRYIFSDITGGMIHIPFGYYDALCLNSDNTDWALMRHHENIDSLEIYTHDATSLSAYGISSRALPRAEEAADERIAATPGMLWSDRRDTIAMPEGTRYKTITFYPEEAVCHYTVDILDVSNIVSIDGSSIDGTISGMSESYIHGKRQASDTRVTMPFTLTVNQTDDLLHSEFLTFGESPVTANKHLLTIYMYLRDGTKWYYSFDVTSQIADAPDPRHVHIVVRGLPLPTAKTTGGGLHPDVEDWNTENIYLTM